MKVKVMSRGKKVGRGGSIGRDSARRQRGTRFPAVFPTSDTGKFYTSQIDPIPHRCEICWKLHPSFVEAVLCEENCAKIFQFKLQRHQIIILKGFRLYVLKLCRKHPRCGDNANYYECSPLDAKKSEDGGKHIITISEDLLSFGKILS